MVEPLLLSIGMISLNSSPSEERFLVIEETSCVYQSHEDDDECGILTRRGLSMPFNLPPMALCPIHAYEFRDWTVEDTIKEFIEVMTDEDAFDFFREGLDDN